MQIITGNKFVMTVINLTAELLPLEYGKGLTTQISKDGAVTLHSRKCSRGPLQPGTAVTVNGTMLSRAKHNR